MRLIVVRGPKAVEPLVLGEVVAVVGRDDGADLILPSKRVSRRHCEVRVEGGGVRFTDLGSQNMLIDPNGRKLRDAVFVAGERVQVGDFVIEVDAGSEPRERTETLELDPDDVPDDLLLEDDFLETDETSSKGLVETVHVSPTASAILPMRTGPLKVSHRKGGGARLLDALADPDGPTPKAARPPPFVPPAPPGTLRPLIPQSPAVHEAARVAPMPPPAQQPVAPAAPPSVDPLARGLPPMRPTASMAVVSEEGLARGREPRRPTSDPVTTPSPAPRPAPPLRPMAPASMASVPSAAPRGPGIPLLVQGMFVVFLAVGLIVFAPFGGQFALVRATSEGWEAAALARGEMAATSLAVRNAAALATNDKAQLDSCCFASWEGVRTVAITDASGTVLAPPERAGTSLGGGDLVARARKDRVAVSLRSGDDLEIVAPAVQNGTVVGFSWVTFDATAGMPVTSSAWARAFASLLVAMMGALVLMVGGWFTLVRPMSLLADNAESLAHGDAATLMPAARSRSMERLSHAVNRALLRLRHSEGGEA